MIAPALSLGAAVESSGFFRRRSGAFSLARGHKEWLHFAVHDERVSALLNFSVADEVRPAARGEIGRVTCILRTDGRWDGDVATEESATFRVRGGRIDARFEHGAVEYRDGEFRVAVSLPRRGIHVTLALRPLAFPTESNNVVFEDCPPLHWLVVPRLVASGTVSVRGELHPITNAPAYHDHNWGAFRWGKNFVWEWGYGVPTRTEDPFSVVFVRFMDRAHVCDLMRGLLVFRGTGQSRIFRGEELTVTHEGLLGRRKFLKLPRALSLAIPHSSTDVPERLVVSAAREADRVELSFQAEDLAQILAPNDDDLGLTVINEVQGRLTVEGRIGGEPISISERTTFEFLSA